MQESNENIGSYHNSAIKCNTKGIPAIPEASPNLETSKAVTPVITLSKKIEAKIPKETINFSREKFVLDDFTTELKYSLWTDLCGEQTEFQDALE